MDKIERKMNAWKYSKEMDIQVDTKDIDREHERNLLCKKNMQILYGGGANL